MISHRLGLAASIALAVVWLSAAVLKSLDPAAFAEQITQHRITPASWSQPLAYAFIIIELLLASSLITGYRRRIALVVSILLLVFFIVITAVAWSRGDLADCGCFGRLAPRGPDMTILQDIAFIALAIVGLLARRATPRPRRAAAAFAVLTPLLMLLPVAGPWLPFDSLVTDLRPGADLSGLAVENVVQPLDQGTVVLAFVSNDCDACLDALPGLNAITQLDDGPPVVGIFAGDRAMAMDWMFTHVPEFEIGDAPASVLSQYYRRLPRIVLVQDGVVRRIWSQPPTPEEVRVAVGGLGQVRLPDDEVDAGRGP